MKRDTRGRLAWIAVALLATVPVFLAMAHFIVDSGLMEVGSGPSISASTEKSETVLDEQAPELQLERSDGSNFLLADLEGQTLILHFWASWCLPCLEELPALLEFSEQADVRVLAVSVDRDWQLVRDFVGTPVPAAVVRADPAAVSRAFEMPAGLPTTLIVGADGRMRLRLDGPRDWRSRAIQKKWGRP